jgi:hypothetical protein
MNSRIVNCLGPGRRPRQLQPARAQRPAARACLVGLGRSPAIYAPGPCACGDRPHLPHSARSVELIAPPRQPGGYGRYELEAADGVQEGAGEPARPQAGLSSRSEPASSLSLPSLGCRETCDDPGLVDSDDVRGAVAAGAADLVAGPTGTPARRTGRTSALICSRRSWPLPRQAARPRPRTGTGGMSSNSCGNGPQPDCMRSDTRLGNPAARGSASNPATARRPHHWP